MRYQYHCKNRRRIELVRTTKAGGKPVVNGIDFIEVGPEQTSVELHFIHDLQAVPGAVTLRPEHVEIRGGVRVKSVEVSTVNARDNVLTVTVSTPGDFSTYTLALRTGLTDPTPPKGFDPQLSEVDFSFKVECPSEFDCEPPKTCRPVRAEEPQIDYMAKDYNSFRRLMLDRLSVVMPDWKERNAADVGIALVELLAYVGDRLSYAQDAVSTEAYLGTAQHRVSMRRHARLLDYPMHNGCNARVWVTVQLRDGSADGRVLPGPRPGAHVSGTLLLTGSGGPDGLLAQDQVEQALSRGALAFETLDDVRLFFAHNCMRFYTWSDKQCCLPKGSTRATLEGHLESLEPGMVLIFEETRSPATGAEADADAGHRHAVRLTHVKSKAAGGRRLTDPLTKTPITEIAWAAADALPFPLCLSAITDKEHGEKEVPQISVAWGNVVLADHGRTVRDRSFKVKLTPLQLASRAKWPNLRGRLETQDGPITQQGQVLVQTAVQAACRGRLVAQRVGKAKLCAVDSAAPAQAAMRWEMRYVLPAMVILQEGSNDAWEPQRDLLNSGPFHHHFALEAEDDGSAWIRFGDGTLGERPADPQKLRAVFRVGNGRMGNIGAGTLVNIVVDPTTHQNPSEVIPRDAIQRINNPIAASGGTDPEPIEQVRLYAPQAFRVQERAVIEADYADVAERHPEVQTAAATFRWTGSWLTAFVTIDRRGGLELDDSFRQQMKDHISHYRLAGYDVEVNTPILVPLDVFLTVCAKPGYVGSEVKKAILEVLSNRNLQDGRQGFFHPDRFTFGQPVYLSQLYAAVLAVPGIASVTVDTFKRYGALPNQEKENGLLLTGRLEIVRLDNDPNYPEHGRLEIQVVEAA